VEKWAVYMKIQQLYEQGFKVSNIARNLDISRTTVYKYLHRNPDEMAIWMAATKTRRRKLDPYKELILSWLKEQHVLRSLNQKGIIRWDIRIPNKIKLLMNTWQEETEIQHDNEYGE
jgi:transposase